MSLRANSGFQCPHCSRTMPVEGSNGTLKVKGMTIRVRKCEVGHRLMTSERELKALPEEPSAFLALRELLRENIE